MILPSTTSNNNESCLFRQHPGPAHTSLGVAVLTTLTTIITSMVAVVGFLFGVYQYRRNLQLSAFRVYADKYNSILTPDIYEKWSNALCGDKENWKELAPTMIAYLNLVWEGLGGDVLSTKWSNFKSALANMGTRDTRNNQHRLCQACHQAVSVPSSARTTG